MKSIIAVLTIAFLFISAPSSSQAYLLNGLDYSGGAPNYWYSSYSSLISAIEANGERLATTQEMVDLFDHFNFSLTTSTTNIDDFERFVSLFPFTYGMDFPRLHIDGLIESTIGDGTLTINNAHVISSYRDYNEPGVAIAVEFYSSTFSSPAALEGYMLSGYYYGITAWTVREVPEPTTMLLFGTGLIGLVGFARIKKK